MKLTGNVKIVDDRVLLVEAKSKYTTSWYDINDLPESLQVQIVKQDFNLIGFIAVPTFEVRRISNEMQLRAMSAS
jgi:hypothetical protein